MPRPSSLTPHTLPAGFTLIECTDCLGEGYVLRSVYRVLDPREVQCSACNGRGEREQTEQEIEDAEIDAEDRRMGAAEQLGELRAEAMVGL